MLSARQVEFFERMEKVRERGFRPGDEAVAILDGVLVDTAPRRHESGRYYVLVQPMQMHSLPPEGVNADWFIVSTDRCHYGLKCWVPSPDDLHRAGKSAFIQRIRCVSRTEKAATCEVLDDPGTSAEGDEEPTNVYDPDEIVNEERRVVGDDDDTTRPYTLGDTR